MEDEFTSGLRLRVARPDVPPGFVRRERLDRTLTTGVAGAVTLLCAGPGFGKTLAVAAWAEAGFAPGPVAWITAEARDDLQGFWATVLGAMTLVDALPGDSPVRSLIPGQEFGTPEVARIIAELSRLPTPVVLVLDDLHRVSDPGVLASLTELLDHQPDQLRLVLLSRTEPALGLARRRLSGRVTDVRAETLAFTEAESIALCARSGVPLSAGQAAMLWTRTEGWPAGLRLILLSLDADDIAGGLQRIGGYRHDRLVAGYLVEEVLEQLAPTDRRFLLATSVVDEVNIDLARALTGRADSNRALDSLVARNALTVRLHDRPDWFRYHPLLRSLLQERLLAEQPDSVPELHRCAADWYAESGDVITALQHHAHAHDWVAMTHLLGAAALPLVLGPHATELVSALAPARAHAAHKPSADTLLAAAVCAFRERNYDAMRRHTDDADKMYMAQNRPVDPIVAVLLAVLRTALARIRDSVELVDRSNHLLELVQRVPRDEIPAKDGYIVIASNNRGIGLLFADEIDAAESELQQAKSRATVSGLGLVELAASAHLGLVDVILGQLPAAGRSAVAALDLAERRGWTREPQALAAYAAAALTHLGRGELDRADECIALGRIARHPNTDSGARLVVEIAAVTAALARHDTFTARRAELGLRSAQEQAGRLPAMLQRWIRVTCADVALATATDPAAVLAVIPDPGTDIGYAAGLERILRAKIQLAEKKPAAVIESLGPPQRFAPYRALSVEAALLCALAARDLRLDSVALDRMAEAIALAEPVELRAPFAAAGPRIASLLDRYQQVVGEHAEFTRGIAGARAAGAPDLQVAPATLTERELAVLRYLPTMYKTSEIAADLNVSTNTVKTHQQAIYRKFGVTTRRAAVTRARELGLL